MTKENKKIIKGAFVLSLFVIIITCAILVFYNLTKENKTEQFNCQSRRLQHKNDCKYNYINNDIFQPSLFKITFLEFGSTGCRDCKKMEKVIEEVKLKYKKSVNAIFCNVRNKENKAITKYFGIQMIPVQVLLDSNGNVLFRHLGYYSFNELSDKFKKYGVF